MQAGTLLKNLETALIHTEQTEDKTANLTASVAIRNAIQHIQEVRGASPLRCRDVYEHCRETINNHYPQFSDLLPALKN